LRIAHFSDLHLDFAPGGQRRQLVLEAIAEALVSYETDVVLIAGDLTNGRPDLLAKNLAPLAVGRLGNLVLEGNHDVWRTAAELRNGRDSFGAQSLFRDRVHEAGFHYLPGHPLTISDERETWGFAGSLGWYDYTFADPNLDVPLEAYRQKRWGSLVQEDINYALWMGHGQFYSDPEMTDYFLAQLEHDFATLGLDEGGAGPPTVVATHTLPYDELVEHRRDDEEWNFFNAFMGSARLGELYDRYPQVRAAFAGHTHRAKGFTRPDGFLASVAPLGYYGTDEFPKWDMASRIGFFETAGDHLVRL
jgi:3',5'-cyclic AMP phosphodiesterase CpdA